MDVLVQVILNPTDFMYVLVYVRMFVHTKQYHDSVFLAIDECMNEAC